MAFYIMNSVVAFKSVCFWRYNSTLFFPLNAWSFLLKEEFQPQPLLLSMKLNNSGKKIALIGVERSNCIKSVSVAKLISKKTEWGGNSGFCVCLHHVCILGIFCSSNSDIALKAGTVQDCFTLQEWGIPVFLQTVQSTLITGSIILVFHLWFISTWNVPRALLAAWCCKAHHPGGWDTGNSVPS